MQLPAASPGQNAARRWRRLAFALALGLPLIGISGTLVLMLLQRLSLYGGSTPDGTVAMLPLVYLWSLAVNWPFYVFGVFVTRRLARATDRIVETTWATGTALAGLALPYVVGYCGLAWEFTSGSADAGAGVGAFLALAAFLPAAALAVIGWMAGGLAATATR